ncbi:FadR/GntR family transcriptional regulator [Actinacidiphila guanduensis]|jgi:DNA-binding FadR family transcriptional regulator|uniref:Transcriptional regulator, GntR family n=1 Tax=Actinacidiphila guanduensis TaxID=310781 RepID=A0A1G9VGA7_9ACTN|nr:FadR/GntR family transcriptional regulator [Actinacidiphila guanduensis]SDM70865.1 transcriptional regulator, GntR family [Actinacidiphila guanduensis]
MPPRRTAARSEEGQSGGLLSPVTDRRISALIVDQVRSLIHEGKLTPGDRLPPEREMCERFGVSRVTVREALRVLEAGGLVEIRVGAHGGAFVTQPTSDRVGASITDLLTLSSVSAADVTEVRLVLEVGLVPLLCEHADAEDIAALEEVCDRQEAALSTGHYDVALSAEFHTRLAAASHNTAFEMLVHSFHGPLLMSLTKAQKIAPEMGRRGVEEHRALIEAVRSHDIEAGERIMREHLSRTASRLCLDEPHTKAPRKPAAPAHA